MAGHLLLAEALSCGAGRRSLFDGVDVAVQAGDLCEVRGPNGSGKTTLLRCLAGLRTPDAGRVRRSAAFDYVGHKHGISGRLTPLENVAWAGAIAERRTDPSKVLAALAEVGLEDAADQPCHSLSAGQQRRVALARLCAGSAPLWLLDEPLAALDAVRARQFRRLVAKHRAAGGAVVCATHQAVGCEDAALPEPRIIALS